MKPLIIVAAHKPYPMPEDSMYLPVQAGAALHEPIGFQRDDGGESLSDKNGLYCELTALYWAWKNQPSDALGLAHYRRYLSIDGRQPAAAEQIARKLESCPVLLPRKRRYWIETNESQYVHAHGPLALNALKETIADHAPDYLSAFERSLKRTSGHRFNMFIMRRDLADAYCTWLFELLFALESRISGSEAEIPRLYGFLSERMLDCWLETNGLHYEELRVYSTEKTNWVQKGGAFLKRKFRPVEL